MDNWCTFNNGQLFNDERQSPKLLVWSILDGLWVPHSRKFNTSFLEAGSTRTFTEEFIFDCQLMDNLFLPMNNLSPTTRLNDDRH